MAIRRMIGTVASVLLIAGAVAGAAQATAIPPYLLPLRPEVKINAILTTGDSVNNKPDGTPYRMVGIPDGLGAFDNGDGTFTVLMNHELAAPVGIDRAHGANSAFVSKWTIDKKSLAVLHGEDLIQQVATWNPSTGAYNEPAKGVVFSRFCSADLPQKSAFFDDGLGYNGRIFMNGEESGVEGRAFAHLMNGTSYELPALGKLSWENSVANPESGPKTVVVGLDDGQNGQVYVYVGKKTRSSFPIEAAGLTNGTLYGIKVPSLVDESNSTTLTGAVPFELVAFPGVVNQTGAQLDQASETAGVTSFQRPEDGSWDPQNPDNFYFVTTASFTGNSRLWRLHFTDKENPAAGGTIEMLLDGSEGQKMMDNITVSKHGQVLILEDPGNQPYVSRAWVYDIKRDRLSPILSFDPALFTPGAPGFITQDEESSGIIDVSDILGEGWYLLDAQIHLRSSDPELVEGGQLLAIHVPYGK